MMVSLGFICLATRLARLWIKERGTSCLKIRCELFRGGGAGVVRIPQSIMRYANKMLQCIARRLL